MIHIPPFFNVFIYYLYYDLLFLLFLLLFYFLVLYSDFMENGGECQTQFFFFLIKLLLEKFFVFRFSIFLFF